MSQLPPRRTYQASPQPSTVDQRQSASAGDHDLSSRSDAVLAAQLAIQLERSRAALAEKSAEIARLEGRIADFEASQAQLESRLKALERSRYQDVDPVSATLPARALSKGKLSLWDEIKIGALQAWDREQARQLEARLQELRDIEQSYRDQQRQQRELERHSGELERIHRRYSRR